MLFCGNENEIKSHNALSKEIKDNAIMVNSEIDPNNDDKLVVLNGRVSFVGGVIDDEFGIQIESPFVKREVQYYQWKEDSIG